ncbi:MAG: hypothetical protein AB9856_02705 [Cellulosilyticaceae bacterium]
MKNKIIGATALIAYCFPYVFFAMQKDLNEWSMFGHRIATIACIVLLLICIRTRNIMICIIGNFITYTASSLCLLNVVGEKWTWYFTPFTARGLLLFLSIALAVMQIIVYVCFMYFKKRGRNKRP